MNELTPLPTASNAALVLKHARKLAITLMGGTVLLAGILMIVLPGPAILVIPMGLAILATEYVWAQRWLKKLREKAEHLKRLALAHKAALCKKGS